MHIEHLIHKVGLRESTHQKREYHRGAVRTLSFFYTYKNKNIIYPSILYI